MNFDEAKPPIKEDMWEAIDIYLFSNGQQYTPPRKYHFEAEDLICWEDMLQFLARSYYGDTQPSLRLHTIDGQPIEGPLELKDGLAYVAVADSDIFIDSGYEKYLTKANKSREKRNAKLSCSEIEPTSSLACHPCCSCHKFLESSAITNKNEQVTPVATNDANAPDKDLSLNSLAVTKQPGNVIDSATTLSSQIAKKCEVRGGNVIDSVSTLSSKIGNKGEIRGENVIDSATLSSKIGNEDEVRGGNVIDSAALSSKIGNEGEVRVGNVIDSATILSSKIVNKGEVGGDQIPYPADALQQEYIAAYPKQRPQLMTVKRPKQFDKQRVVNKSRGIFRNNRLPIAPTVPLKKSMPEKDILEPMNNPKGLVRSNLKTNPVGSKLKPSSKFPLKRSVPSVAKTPQNKVHLRTTTPDTPTAAPIIEDKVDRDEEKNVLVTNQNEVINNENNVLAIILKPAETTVAKNSKDIHNQNKSESKTMILVNKEVQINVDQASKEVNTTENLVKAEKTVETIDYSATKGVKLATQEENGLVASNATDDNVIAVINKGDVINIKLNIYLNKSRNLKSGSNTDLNDGMVVQTSVQSLHSSINHEFIKTYLSEGSQRVTFARKECLCRYANGETLAKSQSANKTSESQSVGSREEASDEESRMTPNRSGSGYLLKKVDPTTSLETFEKNTTTDNPKQINEVTISVNDTPLYVTSEMTEHKSRKYSELHASSDYIAPTILTTPSPANEPESIIVIAEPTTASHHSIKSTVDKYTQTDWCCVVLEARCHDDGRYSFHLPPLDVLQPDPQSSKDTQQ